MHCRPYRLGLRRARYLVSPSSGCLKSQPYRLAPISSVIHVGPPISGPRSPWTACPRSTWPRGLSSGPETANLADASALASAVAASCLVLSADGSTSTRIPATTRARFLPVHVLALHPESRSTESIDSDSVIGSRSGGLTNRMPVPANGASAWTISLCWSLAIVLFASFASADATAAVNPASAIAEVTPSLCTAIATHTAVTAPMAPSDAVKIGARPQSVPTELIATIAATPTLAKLTLWWLRDEFLSTDHTASCCDDAKRLRVTKDLLAIAILLQVAANVILFRAWRVGSPGQPQRQAARKPPHRRARSPGASARAPGDAATIARGAALVDNDGRLPVTGALQRPGGSGGARGTECARRPLARPTPLARGP